MYGDGHIGEDGLDVTLGCILPLLVGGRRSLMGAVVGLVELLGECGAEGAVEVATFCGWCEAPGGEESQDLSEIVDEDVLVASFDGVREDILGSGITKDEKLCIPFFYAGGADGAYVIVVDEGSNWPGVIGFVVLVGRSGGGDCCVWVR